MSGIRQALPGEHLSPHCGHHCGVRSTADEGTLTFIGHCSCSGCICPYAEYPATISVPAVEWIASEDGMRRRVPMCDSWGTM